MSDDYSIKYHDLKAAVIALYYSAYWHADRTVDEAFFWGAVRDAAEITPGKSAERLGPDRTPPKAFKEIGILHRPRSGGVHFYQHADVIPLGVHETLTVYMLEESSPAALDSQPEGKK